MRQATLTPVLVATALVGFLAVSNQSLWIDEGGAAIKALQPTIQQWWHSLRAENSSNLQLLLQLFYLWGWVKLFGASEYALRASNIPWLFLAIISFWSAFPKKREHFMGMAALTLLSPFIWFYLDEARPYIVLFATTCLLFAVLSRAYYFPVEAAASQNWFRLLCLASFLVCATSATAIPWAGGMLLSAVFLIGVKPFLQSARRSPVTTLVAVGLFGALALYYGWTLRAGARASGIGRTGPINLLFVLYEQLGLAGLGAGRNDLRSAGFSAMREFLFPLSVAVLISMPICIATIQALGDRMNKRLVGLAALAVALPLMAVLGAGGIMHMRILGRHLMPLLPFLLFAIALGIERALHGGRFLRLAAWAFLTMWLVSSLEIRFASRHKKDDYRSAASYAATTLARHGRVWWAADESTALYYKLPLTETDGSNAILPLMSPDDEKLQTSLPPDLIVISKPDIYDGLHSLAAFAAAYDFRRVAQLQAFELWENPSATSPIH